MAYTDDAVNAKLSSLNETQESIVTVAQWIMFHRRHADRTAQLWLFKLKDSNTNKRLNLIYLANGRSSPEAQSQLIQVEVVQQSKARRKEDFLIGFSPIVAEAMATAYKGAPNDVQTKLKRVAEVWRQRQIFEQAIQEAVEARIIDLDKNRSSAKKSLLGGSIFSGSGGAAPSELQSLVKLQIAVSNAALSAEEPEKLALVEHEKLTGPEASIPTPPVHAARLSALLKSLAAAESAVSESVKARCALIQELEKILGTNRSALSKAEARQQVLAAKREMVGTKKHQVEDDILRSLSSGGTDASLQDGGFLHADQSVEPERPEMEALTPPAVEQITPIGSPFPGDTEESEFNPAEPVPPEISLEATWTTLEAETEKSTTMPGLDRVDANGAEESAAKKRKLDSDGQYANGALSHDVDQLIREESRGWVMDRDSDGPKC